MICGLLVSILYGLAIPIALVCLCEREAGFHAAEAGLKFFTEVRMFLTV